MHVLVVGDDPQAAGIIGQALQAEGFHAPLHHHVEPGGCHAEPVEASLDHLSKSRCDAIVFDCQQQGCSGTCPLQQFKAKGNCPPVLVIAPVPIRVNCLNTVADAFLARPYELSHLVAQVRALVRLTEGARVSVLDARMQVGDLMLDPVRRIATRLSRTGPDGKPYKVKLSPRCALLLAVMMDKPGKLFSHKELLAAVWGADFDGNPNVLNVTINLLRAKVDTNFPTQLIHTVPWQGYVVKEPE